MQILGFVSDKEEEMKADEPGEDPEKFSDFEDEKPADSKADKPPTTDQKDPEDEIINKQENPAQPKPQIIDHLDHTLHSSEESYGNIMSYFFAFTVICIIMYLLFHNKQKVKNV